MLRNDVLAVPHTPPQLTSPSLPVRKSFTLLDEGPTPPPSATTAAASAAAVEMNVFVSWADL